MDGKDFSINEALEFAWNGMKSNLHFFIPFVFVILFVSVVPDLAKGILSDSAPVIFSVISLIAWFASMYLGMGAIKISLYALAGKKPHFGYLATSFPVFANYLVGILLYTLIMMGGLFLLIIPGIILGIKYKYIPFLILHQGARPIEALHKSDALTRDIKMKLFVFSLLLLVINIAGFFFFFIGVFLTIPISWLAEVHVYGQLLKQSEGLPVEA